MGNGKHKKVGKLPVNSRITIDYSKPKPSIKFSYPRKNAGQQVRASSVTMLSALVLTYLSIFLVPIIDNKYITETGEYPSSCIYNVNGTIINNTSYFYGFDIQCIVADETKNLSIRYVPEKKNSLFNYNNKEAYWGKAYEDNNTTIFKLFLDKGTLIILVAYLLLFFLYLRICGWLFMNTKWGTNNFPELNKKLHNAHFSCTFKPEDVKDNKLELPLFRNIFMDYEFRGEFADKLVKVEVIEHPFNEIIKKGKRKRKWSKGRKGKKVKNVYLWKAIFTFSEAPVSGKGEVSWT